MSDGSDIVHTTPSHLERPVDLHGDAHGHDLEDEDAEVDVEDGERVLGHGQGLHVKRAAGVVVADQAGEENPERKGEQFSCFGYDIK